MALRSPRSSRASPRQPRRAAAACRLCVTWSRRRASCGSRVAALGPSVQTQPGGGQRHEAVVLGGRGVEERRGDADTLLDAAATLIVFGFLQDKVRRQPRKLVRDFLRKVELSGDGVVILGRAPGGGDVRSALTLAFNTGGDAVNADPAGARPAPQGQPYLANLCTKESERRNGFARFLVRRAVAVASERCAASGGDTRLYLHTDRGSAAHKLFLREGFTEAEEEEPVGSKNPISSLLFGGRDKMKPSLILMQMKLSSDST